MPAQSAFWMYSTLIDAIGFGVDSRGVRKRLSDAGIESRPLWQPIHLSAAHRGAPAYQCEVAERLYRKALSLPCSVGLNPTDQDTVIRTIQEHAQ
jgi:perosamine synthetase